MPNDVVGTVIVEHAETDPDDVIEHDAGLDGALMLSYDSENT